MQTFKSTFQNPETGLYEVDGKSLTEDQLTKIQKLFPQVNWIVIDWKEPKDLIKNENEK